MNIDSGNHVLGLQGLDSFPAPLHQKVFYIQHCIRFVSMKSLHRFNKKWYNYNNASNLIVSLKLHSWSQDVYMSWKMQDLTLLDIKDSGI